jgi:hypothetical protein
MILIILVLLENKYTGIYKYYVFGHYPSSCLYLKTVLFIFKAQRFGDWVLSPSSGKTYSKNIILVLMYHSYKLLDLIYT